MSANDESGVVRGRSPLPKKSCSDKFQFWTTILLGMVDWLRQDFADKLATHMRTALVFRRGDRAMCIEAPGD
jgi:hypothetical protein